MNGQTSACSTAPLSDTSAPRVCRHRLVMPRPALQSHHGLPIANGLLGALVWGDGQATTPLTLSLDRTDLWDLRPVTAYSGPDYTHAQTLALHQAGRHVELKARLEDPYHQPGPTKIPAGRITLLLDSPLTTAPTSVLVPSQALAILQWSDGALLQAFVQGHQPAIDCGFLRLRGLRASPALQAPPFGGKPEGWTRQAGFDGSVADVWDLGYPAPEIVQGASHAAFVQAVWGGASFAVALVWQPLEDGFDATWSIATSADAPQPLAHALATARRGLQAGFDSSLQSHASHWRGLWAHSEVSLGDEPADASREDQPDIQAEGLRATEAAYYLDVYKLLAATRRGAPPISLQGPWTVDNGRLPPWKGDYHHDLNTQMSYWPVYAGNHLALGLGFVDWLWSTREACRAWTQAYFGLPGLNVPMTADLRNRQIGGWRQYTHMASTASWLAHHFDLQWRYSQDREFLAERAWPYLNEVCTFVEAITATRDANGHRSLALSASPEFNDNRPEAWFNGLTNYENALFNWVLGAAAEMAEALDDSVAATRWRSVRAELPPPAIASESGLLIAPGVPLSASHRHMSHLMAIHPLGSLNVSQGQAAQALIEQSLQHLADTGTDMWMGYSFAWQACLLARAGHGDAAARALQIERNHFRFPNSFHANGDWAASGHSKAVFGAFTLEGNMACASAVHEMLLQSHSDAIRLFPALPSHWRRCSFRQLRAQGAVLIDAQCLDGQLQYLQLHSEVSGLCRVAMGLHGPVKTFELTRGQRLVFSLAECGQLQSTTE